MDQTYWQAELGNHRQLLPIRERGREGARGTCGGRGKEEGEGGGEGGKEGKGEGGGRERENV